MAYNEDPYERKPMFTKKNDTEQINDAINKLHDELEVIHPTDEVYSELLTKLERLHALKNDSRSDRVKPDTLALIAGNLAGIMMIVGHERAHVVTSKALSFVSKLK